MIWCIGPWTDTWYNTPFTTLPKIVSEITLVQCHKKHVVLEQLGVWDKKCN